MAKCPIIIRAGIEEADVTTCLEPSVPDRKLEAGEYRFFCQRHLDQLRAGRDPYKAELTRPYQEAS